MNATLLWVIAAFGAIALIGAFWRMKPGMGPFNLRVIGIVLVATLASLLSLTSPAGLTAAMGILGGIAGYLFGLKDSPGQA
jgi:hypothetical protein